MAYYSDSDPIPTFAPAVAQRAAERVFSPAFRKPKLVPYLASILAGATDDPAVIQAAGQKSYAGNTVLGKNGLVFALCEAIEYGYGLWDNNGDMAMFAWLGPQMFFAEERLIFKVMDWRAYVRNVGQRGSSTSWGCVPKSFSDVGVNGCEFNYCFEPDRHSFFGVPAGVKPSDTVAFCKVEPQINILGQRVTDPVQLREFLLMKGTVESQLDALFSGDWAATTAGNNGQEDGILKFFDNWTTRHSYLNATCLNNFSPITMATPTTAAALTSALGVTIPDTPADIEQGKIDWFILQVSKHIEKIEFLVRDIDEGNEVSFNDIALVMNVVDAGTIMWYQFCQTKCPGATITVSNYQELTAFYAEFQTRLRAGLFGGGVLRLRDGREVSIMQMRRQPQGTAEVLVKGWQGSSPNSYGLRVAAMQYSRWYSQVQRTVPNAAAQYKLGMNDTLVRFEPQDSCSDIEHRWNMRLFSNAAWLQLKLTGFPNTPKFNYATWPTMPALPKYSVCTPN